MTTKQSKNKQYSTSYKKGNNLLPEYNTYETSFTKKRIPQTWNDMLLYQLLTTWSGTNLPLNYITSLN